MNTDEPLPTRRSLLERLKDAGDHASWEEFHGIYNGLIFGVARRAGLTGHEAEEAVQDTFVALAKKLPEFHYEPGRDSFKGWLLQLARWKIGDQLRRRTTTARTANETDTPGAVLNDGTNPGERASETPAPRNSQPSPAQDFDAIWDAEWERHLIAQARGKRQVNPEHYAIYHLHVLEERPVVEVRRTLGVSSAAIYVAKHRVGAAMRKELRRLRDAAL